VAYRNGLNHSILLIFNQFWQDLQQREKKQIFVTKALIFVNFLSSGS